MRRSAAALPARAAPHSSARAGGRLSSPVRSVGRFGNAGLSALLAARDESVQMKAAGDCAACAAGSGGVARVMRSPEKAPEDCGKHLGDCEFYRCRERRHPCGEDGYYRGYGLKYCLRFSALARRMSPAGAAWARKTLRCLQDFLHDNVSEETPCVDARQSAFDSHPGCYVEGGICDLGPTEWAQILAVIDSKDLEMKQALLTALMCAGKWILPFSSASPGAPGPASDLDRDPSARRAA